MEQRFEPVLSAARTGAEWAWAELYREHAPAVLGYLRARRAPDAEDLLGEVFLQLARDLSGFEGDARAFRAWVFTVAHHRLLDDVRKRRRRPQTEGGTRWTSSTAASATPRRTRSRSFASSSSRR